MTDIFELFSGIAVVVDDEINVSDSNINKITKFFKEKNIPILSYENLPRDKEVANFHSLSFVLLDWKWSPLASDEMLLKENTEFIKELHKACLVPIFIFTNENPRTIISSLQENKIYSEQNNNLIFIKNKSEVDTSDKLFSALTDWIQTTLSVYIIKEWENKKRVASNNLFWDLYNINPNWVQIFLKTSLSDNVNAAYEFNELLFENLHSRISLINLENLPETACDTSFNAEDIRKIMQGQRLILAEKLLPDMIFTGDIYKIENEYYINVRPQCDCIPRDKTNIEDIDLYLIKGTEKPIDKCNFSTKLGLFTDTEVCVTVFPIDHKTIRFELKEFSVIKFSEIKNYRIGRLLPPFITRLIQKYALYMQRQALPRIPNEATNFD